jgi:tetratricopeptide (TPR) repeat protein
MKRFLPAIRCGAAPLLLLSLFVLGGCTAYEVGGAIQNGRAELRYGDPQMALVHFQHAAALDPDYAGIALIPEGVWTYIGRAHYVLGNIQEARSTLEHATTVHKNDPIAKLYLGLALFRQGERERALGQIVAGLNGLSEWLEYVDFNLTEGRFWDPSRRLRSRMQKLLETISGGDFVWPQLVSEVEWLGKEFEEEIERARRRELWHRDDDDRRRDHRDRSYRSESRSSDRGSRGGRR